MRGSMRPEECVRGSIPVEQSGFLRVSFSPTQLLGGNRGHARRLPPWPTAPFRLKRDRRGYLALAAVPWADAGPPATLATAAISSAA